MIWDAHSNFQLGRGANLDGIQKYKELGYNYISINVGIHPTSLEDTLLSIAGFRKYIHMHHSHYILACSVADVELAREQEKLAIGFDLEGSSAFLQNLEMIDLCKSLGVNQALLAYNTDNEVSGGCLGDGRGLSTLGKSIITRMNKAGMMVDLSHMSERATFEAMEQSDRPCIFSHSNPKSLKDHPRNITDRQIKACAAQGGVVGINGIGPFLGGNSCTSEKIVAHICYIAELVGSEHVGLGLDTECNMSSNDFFQANPEVNPIASDEDCAIASCDQVLEIQALLDRQSLTPKDINNIMGNNFYRVAKQVWAI